MTSSRRWRAIAGSFAIYLLPIVTVHWTDVLGGVVIRRLASCADTCKPAWVAADLAAAVALQCAAAVVIAWALGGGVRRRLAALGTVPIFFVAAGFLFLSAIPLAMLVEPDPSPEKLEWPEHCRLAAPDRHAGRSTRSAPSRLVGGASERHLRTPRPRIVPRPHECARSTSSDCRFSEAPCARDERANRFGGAGRGRPANRQSDAAATGGCRSTRCSTRGRCSGERLAVASNAVLLQREGAIGGDDSRRKTVFFSAALALDDARLTELFRSSE